MTSMCISKDTNPLQAPEAVKYWYAFSNVILGRIHFCPFPVALVTSVCALDINH